MDCVVTPLKTLMGFSVHLNVQLKFYNLPYVYNVVVRGSIRILPSKVLRLIYLHLRNTSK
ncbi:hypothetical protein EFS33_12855 [Lactiplantibacillus plantarum]|nr:hypothetical protein [Lactiplantibacillus plantarum]MCT4461180.1 hypothetical protein [Lactiplantibacillus plantarum]